MKNLYFKCDKCGKKHTESYLGEVCGCGSSVYIVKFINIKPNIIDMGSIINTKELILVDVV